MSWRPVAPVALLGVTGALVARTTVPGIPPALALALAAYVSVIGAGLYFLATRPIDRFMQGLREAGVRPEVVADDLSWAGRRSLIAWSPEGEWRVWTVRRGATMALFVEGPGIPAHEVPADATWSAARAAAGQARRSHARTT